MSGIYQAIIFDFDNTLINYNRCEQQSLKQTLLRHGIIRDEETEWSRFREIYDPINWSYWERRHDYTRDELTLFTFRDALKHYLGNIEAAELLADTYWDIFCNSCYFEPGAHDILKYVSRSRRIGMITNGYADSQRKRLQACGIEHYFHTLVISDEVGIWKPDAGIFEVALDGLGCDRKEVLFVGDSLRDDYEGARNAGIDFCFYNRDGVDVDVRTPNYIIRHLADLENIL